MHMIRHHFQGHDNEAVFHADLLQDLPEPFLYLVDQRFSSVSRAEHKMIVDERNCGGRSSILLSHKHILLL